MLSVPAAFMLSVLAASLSAVSRVSSIPESPPSSADVPRPFSSISSILFSSIPSFSSFSLLSLFSSSSVSGSSFFGIRIRITSPILRGVSRGMNTPFSVISRHSEAPSISPRQACAGIPGTAGTKSIQSPALITVESFPSFLLINSDAGCAAVP